MKMKTIIASLFAGSLFVASANLTGESDFSDEEMPVAPTTPYSSPVKDREGLPVIPTAEEVYHEKRAKRLNAVNFNDNFCVPEEEWVCRTPVKSKRDDSDRFRELQCKERELREKEKAPRENQKRTSRGVCLIEWFVMIQDQV